MLICAVLQVLSKTADVLLEVLQHGCQQGLSKAFDSLLSKHVHRCKHCYMCYVHNANFVKYELVV
jgi:hypothetical protein